MFSKPTFPTHSTRFFMISESKVVDTFYIQVQIQPTESTPGRFVFVCNGEIISFNGQITEDLCIATTEGVLLKALLSEQNAVIGFELFEAESLGSSLFLREQVEFNLEIIDAVPSISLEETFEF